MGFKQVYFYDGTPYLVSQNQSGDFQYPDDDWTDIAPPEGIYSPFHFDPLINEWIGVSREQWLTAVFDKDDEVSSIEVDEKDAVIAELTLKVLESQDEINSLKNDVANLTLTFLGGDTNA
ncbi:hypothetical protein [Staphylococcus americanisciuri]|uniref:Uncharacterized protein n=1 Tax=Staphylococcus americanisciuri TaxID=2973940 RepID=A0ABT2F573_9STAP|nr:hypothetical protein [Staphylococcus americanisciuri]MCS4487181.1 hypothetical protein [Staphylococcus americanisciuri]